MLQPHTLLNEGRGVGDPSGHVGNLPQGEAEAQSGHDPAGQAPSPGARWCSCPGRPCRLSGSWGAASVHSSALRGGTLGLRARIPSRSSVGLRAQGQGSNQVRPRQPQLFAAFRAPGLRLP